MESKRFGKVLIVILFSIFILHLLELNSPFSSGVIIGVVELITEFIALRFLYTTWKNYSHLPLISQVSLASFFGFLFSADFFYIVFFYIFGFDNQLWWTSSLTTCLYGMSYLSIAICLVTASKDTNYKTVVKPISLLPLFLFIPICYQLILGPLLDSISMDAVTFYQGSQVFLAVSTLFAVMVAFLTLVSCRAMFWSMLAVGVLTLGFADWAIRVESLNGAKPEFGFYEYFWGLGVFICTSSVMIYKTAIKKIAVFDRRSLLCSYKLGSVTLTLVLIVFFCLSQHENSEIVKIVSFGSSVGAIIAVFVSHFLTEKVHEFAERLGNLISKKGVEINQTLLTKESLNFPVELAETFRVVFERRVQEHYDQEKQNFEMKMIESRSELASQVAHDIRSPIAALEVIAEHTAQFPEEKRLLIKGAISRIKDIANNLLEKNRALTLDENASLNDADFRLNPNTIQLIPSLIDSLLSEKREQYRTKSGVEIQELFDETSYGLFASVQTGEFKRVLSNLIDNAVESIEDEGKVVIRIFGNENQIRIKIKDTGKGIAKDLLSKLGSKGQTHGKNSGTGLGLYHARLCARKWGGDLLIRSQPGKGTSVYFDLLRASAPDWFMPELKFTAKTQLVILDDDHFIHDLWRSRLKDIENQSENAIPIQVNHFFNIEDLGRFYRSFTGNRQDLFFLCDYELVGSAMDGLQFIQELHIEEQSVLITSHFDDLGLQSKCSEMGVRFIPKNLAGFVPIKMDQLSVSKKFKKLIGLPDSKSKPSMGFENQILARNR